MEAVIIAAGPGSRLRHLHSPKPLTPVFGLRLIERIILAGRLAGIRDFKIVVGYESERIKKEIGRGTKYGVRIEYIHNDEWQKGNGVSVLKARGHVADRFLLLMSDHLFDEAILRKLLRTGVEPGQCVLCVDSNLTGGHFDLDDVTRVHCRNTRVVRVDKTLEQFNAIDTGIFLCTPVIFDALSISVARGEYGLSAGNQILADRGVLRTLDISGHFWLDIDSEEALRKGQRTLIQQLFKTTDGPISRTVNRRFSTRISAYLARYNVSPNSLTLVSFGLAVFSAVLFALGGYAGTLAGGIMAQLSSILDGCDGEIARLKFKFSFFGKWLDRVLDRYADGLMMLGITYSLYRSTNNDLVWLVGFLALTGTFMNSYTASFYDVHLRNAPAGRRTMRLGRDVRVFVIFLGAVFDQLFVAIALLAVVTNVESIRRLFAIRRSQVPETPEVLPMVRPSGPPLRRKTTAAPAVAGSSDP